MHIHNYVCVQMCYINYYAYIYCTLIVLYIHTYNATIYNYNYDFDVCMSDILPALFSKHYVICILNCTCS